MPELCTARLVVKGRVQGVFYRQATREKAAQLKLSGWVRNRSDGAVELTAVGPKEDVAKLVSWCKSGPPRARVDSVDVDINPINDEDGAGSGRFDVWPDSYA